MDLNPDYTMAWIIWIAQFLAIEGAALANKRKGDTLTEHVKRWFAVSDKPGGWKWRRASLGAFLVWLVWHFVGRWF